MIVQYIPWNIQFYCGYTIIIWGSSWFIYSYSSVLTHWSCCSLALSYRYLVKTICIFLGMCGDFCVEYKYLRHGLLITYNRILQDLIIYSCPIYLILAQRSWNKCISTVRLLHTFAPDLLQVITPTNDVLLRSRGAFQKGLRALKSKSS